MQNFNEIINLMTQSLYTSLYLFRMYLLTEEPGKIYKYNHWTFGMSFISGRVKLSSVHSAFWPDTANEYSVQVEKCTSRALFKYAAMQEHPTRIPLYFLTIQLTRSAKLSMSSL